MVREELELRKTKLMKTISFEIISTHLFKEHKLIKIGLLIKIDKETPYWPWIIGWVKTMSLKWHRSCSKISKIASYREKYTRWERDISFVHQCQAHNVERKKAKVSHKWLVTNGFIHNIRTIWFRFPFWRVHSKHWK